MTKPKAKAKAKPAKPAAPKFYFDDEAEGPAKKTSHPRFVELCKTPFFYDCVDDFAPFGNDAGNDLLKHIEDNYRARSPKKLWNVLRGICSDWGIEFRHICETRAAVVKKLLANSDSETQLVELDKMVIAAAFGQLKITGAVDADILEAAIATMDRQRTVREHNDTAYEGWDDDGEKKAADKKIRAVLDKLVSAGR